MVQVVPDIEQGYINSLRRYELRVGDLERVSRHSHFKAVADFIFLYRHLAHLESSRTSKSFLGIVGSLHRLKEIHQQKVSMPS